jgi:hypothetical protein
LDNLVEGIEGLLPNLGDHGGRGSLWWKMVSVALNFTEDFGNSFEKNMLSISRVDV